MLAFNKRHALRDILPLVGDIYEAALNTQLWPSVLVQVADAVNGSTTALSVHDPSRQWGSIMAGVRGDPHLRARYEEYYCRINPHMPNGTAKLPTGVVGIGQAAISDEALARTEYYDGFLRPQDIFHMAGGVIAREGSLEYVYTTSRARRKGQFQPDELEHLQQILPHLARAARISRDLTVSGQILQSFESLRLGLAVVDSRGHIVVLNSQASEILKQNDGLALGGNGQLATHPFSEQSLLAPLFGAIQTSMGRGLSSGGDLLIPRPSGKRPYRLSITPLRLSNFGQQYKQVAAAVFMTDPEQEIPVDEELLKKYYSVTKKEAALAVLLVQGKDLDEVSETLGVEKTTVRTHLRGLMQKVGVNRQSELVLALSRMLGPISPR